MEEAGEVRSGFATVTSGTLFLLVATLLLVVLNFFARVLIVRDVPATAWDAFSLGFTLTQVLVAVGTLGVPTAVARSLPYAASAAERRTIVRTGLAVGTLAALASGLALFLAGPAIGRSLGSPELGAGLGYFALALASLILGTLLASVFQGFSNVTPNALFLQIVNPGLFLAFLSLSVVIPPGHVTYETALVAYAASAAVTLAILLAYTARRLPADVPLRGALDRVARSRLVRLAVPLFIYGTMVSVAGSGDTLVLGALRYAEVGAYTASLTLARLVQIGVGAASYIFLPVASGFLARGNRRALGLTYTTITKWLTVFSLPLFLVFVFLPTGSLTLVYGSSYASVTEPLRIVVAGAFAGTLLGPAAMAQVAVGQARLLAVNASVAAAVDIGLAFALVPAYGEVGAAIAWAVANVLYSSLCLVQLAAAEGYHPFRRHFVVPLLVTAVPVGVALTVLHPRFSLLELPFLAIGCALAFALVVLGTGSIDEGDRLLLGAVERLLGFEIPFVRRWAGLIRRGAGPNP